LQDSVHAGRECPLLTLAVDQEQPEAADRTRSHWRVWAWVWV